MMFFLRDQMIGRKTTGNLTQTNATQPVDGEYFSVNNIASSSSVNDFQIDETLIHIPDNSGDASTSSP
jgi:hypothetical protein